MKITPLDIKKQEFKRAFRGYDPLEVETFLEMVADEYEEILNERNKLKDEVLTLQTQLKDYQEVEQTLKQTLVNAQESINRARVNTEKEANLILHEAEIKAEKILENARRDLDKLKNEIRMIRSQKESLAGRLRHLLESQIELLKVLEIDDEELITREEKDARADDEPLAKRIENKAKELVQDDAEELGFPTDLRKPDPLKNASESQPETPTKQEDVKEKSEQEKSKKLPDFLDDDQMVF